MFVPYTNKLQTLFQLADLRLEAIFGQLNEFTIEFILCVSEHLSITEINVDRNKLKKNNSNTSVQPAEIY